MTTHADVEVFTHLVFTVTGKPKTTDVDTWCIALDAYFTAKFTTASATAAYLNFATCLTIAEVLLPMYRKGEFNAFAPSSGGDQAGGYQYSAVMKLVPAFINDFMQALDGAAGFSDFLTFTPYK